MTSIALPQEIGEPLRALLPALADLDFFPVYANFSERFFGNFVVLFQRDGVGSFQLARDRGQFLVDGMPQDRLEAAGLWRAFHGIRELQPLLIRFLESQTKT